MSSIPRKALTLSFSEGCRCRGPLTEVNVERAVSDTHGYGRLRLYFRTSSSLDSSI